MADTTTLKGLRFFTTYFFKTSNISFVMLSFIEVFFISGANQPSKVLQIFVLIKFFDLFVIVCMNSGIVLPPELASKQKKP